MHSSTVCHRTLPKILFWMLCVQRLLLYLFAKTWPVGIRIVDLCLPDPSADVTVGYWCHKHNLYVEQPHSATSVDALEMLQQHVHICYRMFVGARSMKPGTVHIQSHIASTVEEHAPFHHISVPQWHELKSVAKYRQLNHVDYPTAHAAIMESHKPLPPIPPTHPIQSVITGATKNL